jgi:hypothetical protein
LKGKFILSPSFHAMRTLSSFTSRLPIAALLLPLLMLATSCSRYNNSGSLSIAGVIYLILAIAAVISLLKQDWGLGKKLLWGAIIWFFPVLGSIIYFLFSGRK